MLERDGVAESKKQYLYLGAAFCLFQNLLELLSHLETQNLTALWRLHMPCPHNANKKLRGQLLQRFYG